MIRLKKILFEGKYDKLVGDIVRDVFKTMNNLNKIYKKRPVNNIGKNINWVKYFHKHKANKMINVGLYNGVIDTGVELYYLVTDSQDGGSYFIDGAAYEEFIPRIEIMIVVNPNDIPQIFSSILPTLKDLVRHEIEHLTQRGWNQKYNKFRKRNDAIRRKITNDPNLYHKYFTLGDEVDANIHGLYAKAKVLKQPYQKIVDDYLDELVKNGIITSDTRFKIYNVWKKRIPKIGGIPVLK